MFFLTPFRLYATVVTLLLALCPCSSYAQSTSTPRVTSLILWDTTRNVEVRTLQNGDIVDISLLPRFTIIAKTSPTRVGSVIFGYQGNSAYSVQNFLPYSISSDHRLRPLTWTNFQLGDNTVSAAPYSRPWGRGRRGQPLAIRFTITRGDLATPTQPPASTITPSPTRTVTNTRTPIFTSLPTATSTSTVTHTATNTPVPPTSTPTSTATSSLRRQRQKHQPPLPLFRRKGSGRFR